MRTTVVAAGAIIFAAVAAVPYVSGRIVEREIREAIDGYKKRQSFVTASIVSTSETGCARSSSRASVRDGAEVARATTRLRHAPFTGLQFASGESEVHFAKRTPRPSTTTSAARRRSRSSSMSILGGASGILRSAAVDKPVIARRRHASSRQLRPGDSRSPRTRLSVRVDAAQGRVRKQGVDRSRRARRVGIRTARRRRSVGALGIQAVVRVVSRRARRAQTSVGLLGVHADDALDGHAAFRACGAHGRRRGRARRSPTRGSRSSSHAASRTCRRRRHQVFGGASQPFGRRHVRSQDAARHARGLRTRRGSCPGASPCCGRQARGAHAAGQRRRFDAREHRQGAHGDRRVLVDRGRRLRHRARAIPAASPCACRRGDGRRAAAQNSSRSSPRASSCARTATRSSSTSPRATASTW